MTQSLVIRQVFPASVGVYIGFAIGYVQVVGLFAGLPAWTSRVVCGVVYVYLLYNMLRYRSRIHIAPFRLSLFFGIKRLAGLERLSLLLSLDPSLVGWTLVGNRLHHSTDLNLRIRAQLGVLFGTSTGTYLAQWVSSYRNTVIDWWSISHGCVLLSISSSVWS